MSLFRLMFSMAGKRYFWFLLLSIFAGLSNAGLLIVVVHQINQTVSGTWDTNLVEYITVYSVLLLAYIYFNKILAVKLIRYAQGVIHKLRLEIIAQLLETDYHSSVKNRSEVITTLTQDTVIISESFLHIIQVSNSIVTVLFCFCYLGYLSIFAILVLFAFLGVGVAVYWHSNRRVQGQLAQAREEEDRFIKFVRDITDGFKEIKLAPEIGAEIFQEKIKTTSNQNVMHNSEGLIGLVHNKLIGQFLLFIYLGGLLTLMPLFMDVPIATIVNYAFIMLYIIRPIEVSLNVIPNISRANISAKKITHLLTLLKSKSRILKVSAKNRWLHDFSKIEIKGMEYTYLEKSMDKPFRMGPVNLEINRGSVFFIHGGNGSGKTTFIYTLLGLYQQSAGEILVDGKLLQQQDYTDFYTIFGAVFSDVYLFEELYGLKTVDTEKIAKYLRLFELEDKVQFDGSKFSTINLSSGQRKRLALIVTLLRDYPVLVLDEWTADQDPFFRKKFYQEVIPILAAEGKTIIAITHDDRYYQFADVLCKMEDGGLKEVLPSRSNNKLLGV